MCVSLEFRGNGRRCRALGLLGWLCLVVVAVACVPFAIAALLSRKCRRSAHSRV
jgi:hypothetical protein